MANLNSNSNSINTANTLIGSTIGVTNSSILGSYATNSTYYNGYNSYDVLSELTDKVLDIEKLSKFDDVKRDIILQLYETLHKTENFYIKSCTLNTLLSYNIFTDKKSLERKLKISKISDDEK